LIHSVGTSSSVGWGVRTPASKRLFSSSMTFDWEGFISKNSTLVFEDDDQDEYEPDP
jgi:hypothetical protein